MATSIAILAQDLIWSDRLARAVEAAGGEPVRAKSAPEFDRALVDADLAIERAVSAGARVLAVGQHDDVEGRKRALSRGAERVLAYRKLFEDGPATVAGFVERAKPVAG